MIRHPFRFRMSFTYSALPFAAAAMFMLGAVAPKQANAQYTFVPNGTNATDWASAASWTGGTPGTFPNATDVTATFNLPLFPTGAFTVGMTNGVPTPPGTLTVGELIVNNTTGTTMDPVINTTFGASGSGGSLVFQSTTGTAKYTESANPSNGGTIINSTITLLSNFTATQDHSNLANPNNGTLFTGMLNGASGITFTKEGAFNLGLINTTDPPAGSDGFFGSYVVNKGALRFIANGLLRNAASFTVNPNGQLQIGVPTGVTTQAINLGGTASLKLGGSGLVSGSTNNAGALRFQTSATTTTTFSSPIELTSNAEINVSPANAVANIAAPISGTNFALTTSGSGTLGLTGNQSNTNSGGLVVSAGIVNLNKGSGAIAVAGTLNVGGTSTVVVQQDEQIVDTALVRFTSTTQQAGILRIGGLNRKETVGAILSTNTKSGTIEANNTDPNSIATLTIAGTQTSKFDGLIRDNASNPGKLAIAKTGSASLELTNGTNVYSGGTTVSGGSLIVSNTTGSATGTGNVTINNTGTLTGGGIVGGGLTVNAGGHVAPSTSGTPGSPTGVLTVGSATFTDPTSALDIEIGGTTFVPGGQVDFDRLAVTGTAALGGALNVSLINGFMPAVNDVFHILTANTSVTGTFATTNLPALASGEAWQVGYTSNYVQLSVVTAPVGTPGDFNSDGKVDAADYVTWRKNDVANATLPNDNGVGNQTARYSLWRGNFGNPPGSGSGLSPGAVPEPSTLILLLLLAPFVGRRTFRRN